MQNRAEPLGNGAVHLFAATCGAASYPRCTRKKNSPKTKMGNTSAPAKATERELQRQLRELQEAKAESTAAIARLQADLRQRQEAEAKRRVDLEECGKARTRNEQKIAALESELQRLQAEMKLPQPVSAETEAQIRQYQRSIEEKQQVISTLNQGIERVRGQLAACEAGQRLPAEAPPAAEGGVAQVPVKTWEELRARYNPSASVNTILTLISARGQGFIPQDFMLPGFLLEGVSLLIEQKIALNEIHDQEFKLAVATSKSLPAGRAWAPVTSFEEWRARYPMIQPHVISLIQGQGVTLRQVLQMGSEVKSMIKSGFTPSQRFHLEQTAANENDLARFQEKSGTPWSPTALDTYLASPAFTEQREARRNMIRNSLELSDRNIRAVYTFVHFL